MAIWFLFQQTDGAAAVVPTLVRWIDGTLLVTTLLTPALAVTDCTTEALLTPTAVASACRQTDLTSDALSVPDALSDQGLS